MDHILKFQLLPEGQDDDDLDERSPAAGQSGETGLGGLGNLESPRLRIDGRQHCRYIFWRIPARAGEFLGLCSFSKCPSICFVTQL